VKRENKNCRFPTHRKKSEIVCLSFVSGYLGRGYWGGGERGKRERLSDRDLKERKNERKRKKKKTWFVIGNSIGMMHDDF